MLEHVQDPVGILTRQGWLSEEGRVLAAVPNSRSLHRQAAVIMGLLDFEEQLNEADHHHGHRRVYNPETFRRDFTAAGLRIDIFGGYWLKPLSNGQIEASWTPEMLDAFMTLGSATQHRRRDLRGGRAVVAIAFKDSMGRTMECRAPDRCTLRPVGRAVANNARARHDLGVGGGGVQREPALRRWRGR